MATNDAPGAELSAKQLKAISALLHESTLERAAKASGVSESTLIRWMKEEAFKAAYRDAKREVVNHATTLLQRCCGQAVGVLVKVATDDDAPASSRVSAAKTILEMSVRSIEIDDLAARVELLEQLLKEQPKPDGT